LNDADARDCKAESGVVVLLHRNEAGADCSNVWRWTRKRKRKKVDVRTYGIGAADFCAIWV